MSDEGINVVSSPEGVFYNGRKYEPGIYEVDGRVIVVRHGGGVEVKGSGEKNGKDTLDWLLIVAGTAGVALVALIVYVFVVMAMRVPS